MIFVGYKKCSTCKKAEKWLESNNIKYGYRDIKEDNPKKEEIENWHKKSGLPIKRFFNTSGIIYREKNLKDKINNMTEEDQYKLLATDGMLVKRPILISDKGVLVGFKEEEWEGYFN